MALDYIVYQIAGFLWGMYFRSFFFSGFWLYAFQVAFFFVFGKGAVTVEEYWFFLPLTFLLYSLLAIGLQWAINAPLLIAYELFSRELYITKVLIQLIILHAILALWAIPAPWGGILLFIAYSLSIIILWFMNRYDIIWALKDGKGGYYYTNCASIFHCQWALYFLPPIIVYTIVEAVHPSFWMFWVVFGLFIIEVLCLFIYHLLAPPPEPAQRAIDVRGRQCSEPVTTPPCDPHSTM